MDMFFDHDLESHMNSFWYETLPVNQSAFVQYNTSTNRPRSEFGQQENHGCISNVNTMNMNKRMIEFWKRICPRRIGNGTEQELERERCYRHMMCERMRREKQKQSYSALHSVLPIGTKNDKNSIVHVATMKVKQLQRYKEELMRQNMELEQVLELKEKEKAKGTMINVMVNNPTSGIDSMVEALKFMKQNRLEVTNIQSVFSPEVFSAQMEVQTEIGGAELEEALKYTLEEAERKFHFGFPGK
ncbi:transcription factor bHLH92 [Ziziphus jujuba]|uniref:Transcription factor bHLH92 n=1 Tax=Ziziphus jujuba TaxID=326968 RepID=A0A6P3ZZP2_ZIZJJ|nr:transcription factor bHLH92 [Ziziphus jujuba]